MGSASSSQPVVVVVANHDSQQQRKKKRGFSLRRSKKDKNQSSAASTLLIQCILAHKYEEASIMLTRNDATAKELASTPVLVRIGSSGNPKKSFVAIHVLPLHVACSQPNVPLNFVQMLMNIYPQALITPTTTPQGETAMSSTTTSEEQNSSGSHRRASLRRRTMDLVTSATTVGMTSDRSKQRSLYAASANNHSNHSMRSLGSHFSASVDTTSEGNTSSNSVNSPPASPDMALGWLPLHVAVTYNTHSVELIDLLLKKDSRALYCKTAQGCLPLHLACTTSPLSTSSSGAPPPPPKKVCSRLLTAFPESRFIPTLDGKLPLDLWKECRGDDKMEMPRELLGRGRNCGEDDGLQCVSSRNNNKRFIHNMMTTTTTSGSNSTRRNSKTGSKKSKTHSPTPQTTGKTLASLFLEPTPLYQSILVQDWDRVLELLRQQPRSAQVWTCNSQLPPRCHVLPLHLAVQEKAPPSVIKALVLLYPKAVSCVEYMGRNVLHAACRMEEDDEDDNNFSALEALLTSAPRAALKTAASTPDANGLLPLHYLAENESAECTNSATVQRLLNAYPQAIVTQAGVRGVTPMDILKEGGGGSPQQRTLLKLLDRGTSYWLAPTPPRGSCLDFLMTRRNYNDLDDEFLLERLSDYPEEATTWYRVLTRGGKTRRMNMLHYICMFHNNHTAQEWSKVLNKLVQKGGSLLSTPCFDEYNMLPLHLAIQYGATPSVLEYLLDAYPAAARYPDAMGLLPIHLACSCDGAPHPSWIQALVNAHPQSLTVRDRKGFTPNVYAKANAFHPNAKRIVELTAA